MYLEYVANVLFLIKSLFIVTIPVGVTFVESQNNSKSKPKAFTIESEVLSIFISTRLPALQGAVISLILYLAFPKTSITCEGEDRERQGYPC